MYIKLSGAKFTHIAKDELTSLCGTKFDDNFTTLRQKELYSGILCKKCEKSFQLKK